MNVVLVRSASKYFNRLDALTQKRVSKALDGLSKEPPEGEIKKLKGMTIPTDRVLAITG